MTETPQDDFDNILLPRGQNTIMEMSNQDLLSFIQNHTAQNNNTQYNSVQSNNMQLQENNPNDVTTRNEMQFFHPQEPSFTTQEQRLEPFNPNHITQQLTLPKEPYPFDTQVPFQITPPNHNERLTNKNIPILDPNVIFMKPDNNTKVVHRHCELDTPSQFLGLYQVQNWLEVKMPETITTKHNCIASPIQMPTQHKQDNNSNIVAHLQKQA